MILNTFITVGLLTILPLFILWMLWQQRFATKLEWLVDVIYALFIFAWLFQAGNWAWIGYYMRYVLVLLFVVTVYFSWKKVRILPFREEYKRGTKMGLYFSGALALLFLVMNGFLLTGYSTKDETIKLDFPLQEGTYYIGQGGAQSQLNYHQEALSQQYALDILKINSFGIRASGLAPKELSQYHIFGDTIYSPCVGEVTEIRNYMPDLIPPDTNAVLPEGNYVSLTCDHIDQDTMVYLAHMQEDSIEVEPGDKVQSGEALGKVGNSGNTTEPHLHIHAEKDGVGIPIEYVDRFLVRNSLVR